MIVYVWHELRETVYAHAIELSIIHRIMACLLIFYVTNGSAHLFLNNFVSGFLIFIQTLFFAVYRHVD